MSGIVVGVDASEGSRAALRWAREEAQLRRCTLTAVTAWQYPVMTTLPAFGMMPPLEDLSAEAEAALRAVLEEEPMPEGVEVRTEVVVAEGSPAGVLLDAAQDAELLVVGSRGHGGFTGMLLGSVSQHCVAHSPCPVVVVRA